jgi:hypothetical protein
MRVATATALAAIAAVVANLLLRAAAVAVFDIPQPEFEPLQARAVVLSTLGGVVAAGVVYAVVLRLAGDPARVFVDRRRRRAGACRCGRRCRSGSPTRRRTPAPTPSRWAR